MYKTKIPLEEALEMESRGEITLVSSYEHDLFHPNAPVWKQNYEALRQKFRNISAEKLLNFLRVDIHVEVFNKIDDETCEWYILHGVRNTIVKDSIKNNIEYIYVLTNPGYPDLVKIGMTERTVVGRVKGINATSTVTEWIPKFALPVEAGTAFRVEQQVHKHFSDLRITSDQGNEREFFRLDSLTAFDKVREIGSIFQVGNPIIY
jgi:hypothetical protein